MEADRDIQHEIEGSYCYTSYDGVLCWNRTKIDTTITQPCFSEFQGVHYDVRNNATRYCSINGVWDLTNYANCHHIYTNNKTCHELDFNLQCSAYATSIIYYIGYSVSLVALILAVIMYMGPGTVGCIFLAILLHYFVLTNFFWMMVEGLYLYMLVVQTFSGDKIRFNLYAVIGWGFPSIFVGFWTVFKAFSSDDENQLELECSWMRESNIDWIIHVPACVVLIINLVFLLCIMWVLITKLRSANTIETRQYRKASKALLVLIPLLGITYLIVIAGPNEGLESHIFAILRAFLISIQGFSVVCIYCFNNSEVRQALKHRLNRWRDSRNLSSGNSIRSRRYTMSKDYSPRSRTESIRLTSTLPITS
ncbi:CLUMA_CG019597, isoform A [Clunio marinus]|uniref:CLUMA_CG019597, isoform A n=1 Tax=Clunio marinus TaxID=568069 RepID=A0A1J1J3J7_9DIPT|nr:CLUMA_CG019597, isoform A [Clunio marinus]